MAQNDKDQKSVKHRFDIPDYKETIKYTFISPFFCFFLAIVIFP